MNDFGLPQKMSRLGQMPQPPSIGDQGVPPGGMGMVGDTSMAGMFGGPPPPDDATELEDIIGRLQAVLDRIRMPMPMPMPWAAGGQGMSPTAYTQPPGMTPDRGW